ncbi:MAG: monofunctional biosynthetic peptidoglycan transglycosylase [Pseudomonadota bacterium]
MGEIWRRVGVAAWVTVKVCVGLVTALHLYAVALIWVSPPGTILMTQRGLEGQAVRRGPVPLSEISPHLIRAVIAAEDTRFCSHSGVDFAAIDQALEERRTDGRVRGASTLTQQTAKNVFFWNGGGYARKAGEAWMAVLIDGLWGKRRVMEAYLNVAEWGDGLFGAEAAARVRFGKSAANLTEREAALLAAVLPSPNKWRAVNPGPYVSRRAGTLQARMRVVERDGLDDCVWS